MDSTRRGKSSNIDGVGRYYDLIKLLQVGGDPETTQYNTREFMQLSRVH